MNKKAALLLLPNLLGEHAHHEVFLPVSVDRAVASIDGLIAESEKGGRRFLARFQTKKPAHEIPLALFNKHTPDSDINFFLEPMEKGERWGLVSDAGVPCIADPGAKLAARARQKGITVQAFVGPSSFVLALMLSGIPAQQFSFHGYLDKNAEMRAQQMKGMQRNAGAQIFMEAPHHNQQTLEAAIGILDDKTILCIATDLTLPTQKVITYPVHLWRKFPLPNIHKRPTTFIIYSEG